MRYREQQVLARRAELTALCLASIGGNSGIDPLKMLDKVQDTLAEAIGHRLPYVDTSPLVHSPPAEPQKEDLDECFKYVNEEMAKIKAKQAAKEETRD